jgi:hypothetical protein
MVGRDGKPKPLYMAWQPCGADGWEMSLSGSYGVLNDALSIYFADATLATPDAVSTRCMRTEGHSSKQEWQEPQLRTMF